VALVGLGTGTALCYGRPEDSWTIYEIDPLMVRIAQDRGLFTYLRLCPPEKHLRLGDARLRLADAPDGAYDLILLDAFSSDAIPAHLVTREALQLYLAKLAPGGLVAYHISNRYLNLQPVLSELARDARVAGVVGRDSGLSATQRAQMLSGSVWVVLARRATDFATLARTPGWTPLAPKADVRVWTDDYSDVLGVFNWR
jgi:spermidine synthase